MYCFNGEAVYLMLSKKIEGIKRFFFFNKKWEIQDLCLDSIKYGKKYSFDQPKNLESMFQWASILSEPFPFVRVDFYNIDEKLIFGEMTFSPSGGYELEGLKEADIHLGNLIQIK